MSLNKKVTYVQKCEKYGNERKPSIEEEARSLLKSESIEADTPEFLVKLASSIGLKETVEKFINDHEKFREFLTFIKDSPKDCLVPDYLSSVETEPHKHAIVIVGQIDSDFIYLDTGRNKRISFEQFWQLMNNFPEKQGPNENTTLYKVGITFDPIEIPEGINKTSQKGANVSTL